MNIENTNVAHAAEKVVAKAVYTKPAMVDLGQMAQVTQKSGGSVDGATQNPKKF